MANNLSRLGDNQRQNIILAIRHCQQKKKQPTKQVLSQGGMVWLGSYLYSRCNFFFSSFIEIYADWYICIVCLSVWERKTLKKKQIIGKWLKKIKKNNVKCYIWQSNTTAALLAIWNSFSPFAKPLPCSVVPQDASVQWPGAGSSYLLENYYYVQAKSKWCTKKRQTPTPLPTSHFLKMQKSMQTPDWLKTSMHFDFTFWGTCQWS